MDKDELKRKLREFKQFEKNIRFKENAYANQSYLVWNEFFSTGEKQGGKARYPLEMLLKLEKQRLKEIYEEYFYQVYFQKYKENGMRFQDVYDARLLAALDLTPYAGVEEIKRKFRELAKKYHPDHGGDSDKMIEILEAYHKLTGK